MAQNDTVTVNNRIVVSDAHERESVTMGELTVTGSVNDAVETADIDRVQPGIITHPTA